MNLNEIKNNLYLPKTVNNPEIKIYLIHENISNYILNNAKEKTSLFSNFLLKHKIATNSNYESIYNDILNNVNNTNDLYDLLYKLYCKIEKKENIEKLKENAINSLSKDSFFYISIGNTDPTLKFINATLENDVLTYDWNYDRRILQDKELINQFKDIILSYKNVLFELSAKPENNDKNLLRNLVLKGKMRNSLQGNIDTLKLSIYPELTQNYELLTNSYFKLKNEVISFLENNINKTKID